MCVTSGFRRGANRYWPTFRNHIPVPLFKGPTGTKNNPRTRHLQVVARRRRNNSQSKLPNVPEQRRSQNSVSRQNGTASRRRICVRTVCIAVRPVHADEQSHASDAGVGIGFLERRECRGSRSWLQSIDRPTPTIPDKTASRILNRIRNMSEVWYRLSGSQISSLYVYSSSLWPNHVSTHTNL
jgi:hypothetical protein